jgi:hypothetical protein
LKQVTRAFGRINDPKRKLAPEPVKVVEIIQPPAPICYIGIRLTGIAHDDDDSRDMAAVS